jgi:hypothetical protein
MLKNIGEAPISTLVTSGRTDVVIALSVLDETLREFCAEGWHFNTDLNFSVALEVVSGQNRIGVPADALRMDPHDPTVDWVARGDGTNTDQLYMWDRDNHTFTMTAAAKFDIVRIVDFDDLPWEGAKRYVTILASRTFAEAILGDSETVSFTDDDLSRARTLVEKAEHDSADHSMYQDATTLNVIGRNRGYGGGYYQGGF